MARSVYVHDDHNRRRFVEFTESTADELVELLYHIDTLSKPDLAQSLRARTLNDLGVLSGDLLADLDILVPMLRDIYTKREMLDER